MAKQLIVFGIILFINLLIVILYLIWNLLLRKKENKGSYWMRAIVMLLCPIVGIVFFALSQALYVLFFSEPVDLEDVIFSKERVRTFVQYGFQRFENRTSAEAYRQLWQALSYA